MYKKDLTAQELAGHILKAKERKTEKAYENLKTKCYAAISTMAANLEFNVTTGLDSEDLPALERVTEELRDLGYKFRFIEKNEESQLYISIEHCRRVTK